MYLDLRTTCLFFSGVTHIVLVRDTQKKKGEVVGGGGDIDQKTHLLDSGNKNRIVYILVGGYCWCCIQVQRMLLKPPKYQHIPHVLI